MHLRMYQIVMFIIAGILAFAALLQSIAFLSSPTTTPSVPGNYNPWRGLAVSESSLSSFALPCAPLQRYFSSSSRTTTPVPHWNNNQAAPPSSLSSPDWDAHDDHHHSTSKGGNNHSLLVEYGDSVYTRGNWDGAPIVVGEPYKLIFFTSAKVGCTVWKQLFRRINHAPDWKEQNWGRKQIPWNPETNGLSYLYDYDRETASHMMTSPEWTRALFVRDPKERFLSAYLDKAKQHPSFLREKCCPTLGQCVEPAKASIDGFFHLILHCHNSHWQLQSARMEAKYWSYIDFVGHMETMSTDAKRLLEQIGAWDEFGASGWGPFGNHSFFQTPAGSAGRRHSTRATQRLVHFISPALEERLEEFYASDYEHPVLNLSKWSIARAG